MNSFTEEALASSKQDILLLMRKAVNKRKKLEKKSSKGEEGGSPSDTPTSQKSGTRGEPSTRSSLSLERLLAKVESSIEETSRQGHRIVLQRDSNGTEKPRNKNRYENESPAERAQRLLRMADAVEQSNIRKKQMMEDPDDMSVFSSADTILTNALDTPGKPRSALEMGLARVDARENDDSDNFSGEEEEEEDDEEYDEEEDDEEDSPRFGRATNATNHDEEYEQGEEDDDDRSEDLNQTPHKDEKKSRDLGTNFYHKPEIVKAAPVTPPASSISSPLLNSNAASNDPIVAQLRRQLQEARTAFVTMQQNAVLRCEKLEMENNETSSSLIRAEAKLRAANDRIAELEREQEAHNNLKMQYAVLSGELASAKREVELSQQTVKSLEDKIESLSQVKVRYEEARRQIDSKTAELETAKARMKKLEDEHQNFEKLSGLSEFDQVHLLTEAQVRGAELEQQLSELSKKHRSTMASHDDLRMIIMSSCRKCRLRLPREQYVAKAAERKRQAVSVKSIEDGTDMSTAKSGDVKASGSLSQFLDSFGLFTKSGDDQSIVSKRSESAPRKSNRAQLDVVMNQIERRMSDDLSSLKKSWLAPLNLNGGSTSRKISDSDAAANAELKKKVEEGLAGTAKPKKKKSSSSLSVDRHKVPASPRSGKAPVECVDERSSSQTNDYSERDHKNMAPETEVPITPSHKKTKKTLGDVLDSRVPERSAEARDAMSLASSIVLAKRRLSSSHKSEAEDTDVEKKMLEILVSDGVQQ